MNVAHPPNREIHAHSLLRLRWIVVLALAIAVLAIVVIVRQTGVRSASTVHGSGIALRQARAVAAFSAVDLSGSNDVTITVGRARSVLVRADDNLIGNVKTRVHAGTLVIDTTGTFTTKTPMSVTISVPSLRALRLSGSGTVTADGIHTARFAVELSGSGIVRARGSVTRLDATLGGSGQALLAGLVARDVRASLAGSGEIRVTATERLDASLPGSGAITYAGKPGHVSKSVTGSGTITRA